MTTPASIRPDYTPHARAERLIAAGRFVLGFFSLVAIYLEPSTPAKYQQATYSLLAIYTVYAAATVVYAWRSSVPSRRWRLLSHAADLVLFSVFISLTEGPASPFFLYFVFSLFCATLRFSWRGILATGAAAAVIYGGLAFLTPHAEASRVLIREVYLAVIAALLVYLGLHQERLRSELASLAAWPRELAEQVDDVLRGTLAHTAGILRAGRVLLLWEEREEPWLYAGHWWNGEFRLEKLPPGTVEPLAREALVNTSYFARAGDETILVYRPGQPTVSTGRGNPVGTALRLRFNLDSAVVVSLESEALTACLVVPGVRSATADDLALAHIAGRLVLATLEQFLFVQQARQTASAEERLRISRELHDGIVQSLGGVGLQLQAIRAGLGDASAATRLEQVQKVIEHDQRELRAIVRELRPHDPRRGGVLLRDELQRMRERFALEWGLQVSVRLGETVEVPARLAHELCRIVNESLSNAARHGAASQAEVEIGVAGGTVDLRVSDNGRGFPFTGRFELADLDGRGPRTLQERVVTLGGSLTIDSSTSGAAVIARVPLPEAG